MPRSFHELPACCARRRGLRGRQSRWGRGPTPIGRERPRLPVALARASQGSTACRWKGACRLSTTVPPSWPILEDAQAGQPGRIPRCLPPLMIRCQHARHEPEDSGRLDDLGPAGGYPLPATVQYIAIVACAGAEMPLCQRKHGTNGSCDRRFAVCGPRFGCTVRSQFSRARQRAPTRRARRYG